MISRLLPRARKKRGATPLDRSIDQSVVSTASGSSLDKQFDPAAFKAEAGQNCFGKSNLTGQPRDLILLARMGE